jgi:hypothetical protein
VLQVTPGSTYAIQIGAGGTGGTAESPVLVTTTTGSFTEPTNDGAHSTTVTVADPSWFYTGAAINIADGGYYIATAISSNTMTILSSGLSGQADAGATIGSGQGVYTIGVFPTSGGDTSFNTTLADGGAGTALWNWFGAVRGPIGSSNQGSTATGGFGGAGGSRLMALYGWGPINSVASSVSYFGGATGGQAGGATHATASVFSGLGLSVPFAGFDPDGGNNIGTTGAVTADSGGGGGFGGAGGWNWLDSPLSASTCVGGNGGQGGDSTDPIVPGSGTNPDGGVSANSGGGGCGGGGGGGSTLAGAAAGVGGNGMNGGSGKLVGCYVTVHW